jgi:hypothetical protein
VNVVVVATAPAGTVTVTVCEPADALSDPPAAEIDWVAEPLVGGVPGPTTGGVDGELDPPPQPASRSAVAVRMAARL